MIVRQDGDKVCLQCGHVLEYNSRHDLGSLWTPAMSADVSDWIPHGRWLAGKLPRGFITLADAVQRTGVEYFTLRGWVRRGIIKERGRIFNPRNEHAQGQCVVALADMLDYIRLPKDGAGHVLSKAD